MMPNFVYKIEGCHWQFSAKGAPEFLTGGLLRYRSTSAANRALSAFAQLCRRSTEIWRSYTTVLQIECYFSNSGN